MNVPKSVLERVKRYIYGAFAATMPCGRAAGASGGAREADGRAGGGRLARRIPGARLVMFPELGHLLWWRTRMASPRR
jgi:hypothetical protein